ncbi:NAD(P)/FAD-dependent oxidoreductase [Lysinibacillus antri]|uniref:FAD-binding protein n=1 Tax=Lysinibacillus antri TaxID=2498145 RepID=A0A432L6S8_9BACI|nr:FAD-dependent oxidoreductase [Lysinibacillus antri]RUL46486.1 FAD-binding protein [Lysinibacillus antri]
MKADVVVVGAGPAGLVSSIELAKHGLNVIVVDEYYRSGGRLLGQLYEDTTSKESEMWDGKIIAQQLTLEAESLGVTILYNTTVWKIEKNILFLSNNQVKEIHTHSIILATGAIEKALPIRGWQKVGVLSVGAAQTFTNLHHVKIGENILFVGIDPLSISVAMEMKKAGMNVVGMMLPPPSHLTNEQSNPEEVLGKLGMVANMAPNFIFRMGGKLAKGKFKPIILKLLKYNFLKLNGLPIFLRKAITSINGETEVESVVVKAMTSDGKLVGKETELQVDTVCLSGGLLPLVDLSQIANCLLVDIPELGGIVPLHNKYLKTSIEGIYVAGNITGIEGAKVAMAQGKLAASSLLFDLGKIDDKQLNDAYHNVEIARNASPISFLPHIKEGRKIMEEKWQAYSIVIGDT